MLLAAAVAAAFVYTVATLPSWPTQVTAYRALLGNFSKDLPAWSKAAAALRSFMQQHDPDYPVFHLAAPEGWVNDPNGVSFDPSTGLYHRFYQYDKTYSEQCKHGSVGNCTRWAYGRRNTLGRTWGHTVSEDLVVWEDWPGIDADSVWDANGVFSGNCEVGANGNVTCIYSGNQLGAGGCCTVGVCATSSDFVHWRKAACMNVPPGPGSPVNDDTSIWRDHRTGIWYLLIGGHTFNGTNTPTAGVPQAGNAQLWNSSDLVNFTYMHPLTPGTTCYLLH